MYCYVQSNNGGGVNVRETKSTSSFRLGTIPDGARVNIVTCDSTWATLVYNGTPAFIQHRYIDSPPDGYGWGLTENERALCNGNSVNVRASASTSASVVGTLSKGVAVTVYDFSMVGNYTWYRIGSGRWVRGDYLAPASGYTGDTDVSTNEIPNNQYEMFGPSTQTLRRGDQGQAVRNLQHTLIVGRYLNEDLIHSEADGIFGSRTETAVREFQEKNGLTVDGIVGSATKAKLWELYGELARTLCRKVT